MLDPAVIETENESIARAIPTNNADTISILLFCHDNHGGRWGT